MYIDVGQEGPSGSLAALVHDFLGGPYSADWARRVTDRRIIMFDRVRPFLTRGLLLTVMAVHLALLPGARWVAWLMLVPGVTQTALELVLDSRVRGRSKNHGGTGGVFGPIVRFQNSMYEHLPLNVTGLIGAVAVVSNIATALFAIDLDPPSDSLLRASLLATAILYCNSGVLNTLLDSTWFSPRSALPPAMRRLHPFYWILLLLVCSGALLLSWHVGRWPLDLLPHGLLALSLLYYIGLRIREYIRDLRAAAVVLNIASQEERAHLSRELHDMFQPAKYEMLHMIDESPNVSAAQRTALRTFYWDLKELYDEARRGDFDPGTVLQPSLESRVRRVLDGSSIDYTGSRFELDGRIHGEQLRLARQLITTLCHNVKQAYEDRPFLLEARIHIEAYLDHRDHAHVIMTDHLPPIPPADFAREGSTLGRLREDLRALGGELIQKVETDRKRIVATWDTHLPPLRDEEHGNGY